MPLPASWVDALFARLTLRYGAAFLRQWPDSDPAAVKADWSEVLDGVRGESLQYALRYLPTAPCTALAFRDLCRRAPAPALPALTDDGVRADPQRVQQLVSKIDRAPSALTPAQQCAENIVAIATGRGRMSPPQEAQIRAMERFLTSAQIERARSFVPGLRALAEVE